MIEEQKTTLTAKTAHGYDVGDVMTVKVLDRRWWMRLWRFITFRQPPTVTTKYMVTSVSKTEMTIHDGVLRA